MKARLFTPPRLLPPSRALALLLLLLSINSASRAQTPQAAYQRAPTDCDQLVASAARRYSLDYFILRALVTQESGCRAGAVSHKGAQGVMQLMPATAARFEVKNPFDPVENIEGGARYLRWLLTYFGEDYVLALAGYNAGEGAVMKYGRRVPPYAETINYVNNILRRAALYRGGQLMPSASLQLTARVTPRARGSAPVGKPSEVPAEDEIETESIYFWQ